MLLLPRARWRPDYAADITTGIDNVHDYKFVNSVCIADAGVEFPVYIYLEKPPRIGTNPERLHLFACKQVPKAVRLTVHPAAFKSRRAIPGWIMDPGRKGWIWQEAENGACSWEVPSVQSPVNKYTCYQETHQQL